MKVKHVTAASDFLKSHSEDDNSDNNDDNTEQTWNLSKNLHDRIFRQKNLHSENA